MQLDEDIIYWVETGKNCDLYLKESDNTFKHKCFPKEFCEYYLQNINSKQLILKDILAELKHGEVFETSECIYVELADEDRIIKKSSLYAVAAKELCSIVDTLQQVEGFLPMTQLQLKRLHTYVIDVLSSVEDMPKELDIPIFASFNYLNPIGDDMPQYISIQTTSEQFMNAINKIELNVVPESSLFLCYSYILKKLINQ